MVEGQNKDQAYFILFFIFLENVEQQMGLWLQFNSAIGRLFISRIHIDYEVY
jgi:hypothetical protein